MNIKKIKKIDLTPRTAYLSGVIIGDGNLSSSVKSKTDLSEDYRMYIDLSSTVHSAPRGRGSTAPHGPLGGARLPGNFFLPEIIFVIRTIYNAFGGRQHAHGLHFRRRRAVRMPPREHLNTPDSAQVE